MPIPESLTWIAEDLRALAAPVADLHEDPANARLHDERNLSQIKASLKEFGQRKPIVATSTGRIVAGNGTYHAAVELGHDTIAVSRFDGDPRELTRYAIADNRTAELATWDEEALSRLGGDELGTLGFDDEDLALIDFDVRS